jgi:hypothetical protein
MRRRLEDFIVEELDLAIGASIAEKIESEIRCFLAFT